MATKSTRRPSSRRFSRARLERLVEASHKVDGQEGSAAGASRKRALERKDKATPVLTHGGHDVSLPEEEEVLAVVDDDGREVPHAGVRPVRRIHLWRRVKVVKFGQRRNRQQHAPLPVRQIVAKDAPIQTLVVGGDLPVPNVLHRRDGGCWCRRRSAPRTPRPSGCGTRRTRARMPAT